MDVEVGGLVDDNAVDNMCNLVTIGNNLDDVPPAVRFFGVLCLYDSGVFFAESFAVGGDGGADEPDVAAVAFLNLTFD